MKKIPKSVKRPVFYTLMLVAIILLGWAGFMDYYYMLNMERGTSSIMYDILRLFFLEHDFEQDQIPVALNIARFLAPLLFATALMDVLYSFLKNKVDTIIIRWFYRDHVVFCGLGYQNLVLARLFLKGKNKIVIIESNSNNISLNEFSKKKDIKIVKGNANDIKNLQKAGIIKANKVFIACGNDLENLKIAKNIQNVFDNKRDRINSIRRKNQSRSVLLTINISGFENEYLFKKMEDKKGDSLDIRSFNAFTKFAAFLVDKYSPDKTLTLTNGVNNPAHVFIWGDNKLAESVLVEAAHLYHFSDLRKLRITLVCSNPAQIINQIKMHYPNIQKVVDLSVLDKTVLFDENFQVFTQDVSIGFVCEENSAAGFIAAKRLRQMFFNASLRSEHLIQKLTKVEKNKLMSNPPIVIADSNPEDISTLFQNHEDYLKKLSISRHNKFREVFTEDMMIRGVEQIDNIAKQIHNLYLGLNAADLDIDWELLTDAGKDQNRWAARHLFIKLRFLGIALKNKNQDGVPFDFNTVTDDNLKILAKMEHNRWVAEKLLTGFTEGQSMEDDMFYRDLKKYLNWHKDIKAWEELDKSTQEIDEVLSNIEEIAKKVGKKLVKVDLAKQ